MEVFVNLIYFLSCMVMTLVSVALGGYLVYKVKLPQESMFEVGLGKGSAYNIDPFAEPEPDKGKEVISRIQKRANSKFREVLENAAN